MPSTHKTAIADQGTLVQDGPDAVKLARDLHHLATADPGMDRDGQPTGPLHEAKYGLERAESSAELWRGVGVHPFENRALVAGEDGAENLRGDVSGDKSEGSPKAITPADPPKK